MPNDKWLSRISSGAKFLASPAAKESKEWLDRPLRLAMKITALLEDKNDWDIDALVHYSSLNRNTVLAIVRELSRGGYPIEVFEDKESQGKRLIIRKVNENVKQKTNQRSRASKG